MTSRRLTRKHDVRDWVIDHPDVTLLQICEATSLTPAAVGRALRDIRDDPSLEYATVATKAGGYTYRIAFTVEQMKAGLRSQLLHMLTRAESMMSAGDKATQIAATPDEFALAADIKANGRMMKMQAEAMLSALAGRPMLPGVNQ